jgi:DNA-binding beta-propeller fold protein YncE
MTTPTIEPESAEAVESVEVGEPSVVGADNTEELIDTEEESRKRRRLLLILLWLLLLCCCLGILIGRYLLKPQPLPDLLIPTQVGICLQPRYQSSISNVDGPVAVAGSPDGQRIYVAEGAGKRLVKVFDRNGSLLFTFAPPGTDPANREPKYMAVAPDGRVFLVDRTSSGIDIYDADGKFIDAIIGQHMTLSKYIVGKLGKLPEGLEILHYEGINRVLTFKANGVATQDIEVTFPADEPQWSPLGLRFNANGDLIYTDTTTGMHSVRVISAADLNVGSASASAPLVAFNPFISHFGSEGKAKDQLSFPQSVVLDGQGNFFVSDGNNGRITEWTPDMKYKTFFGFGSAVNGALNLPRGMWMAPRGCLLVADAVGSLIRVYNISGNEPALAFELGGYGIAEGQFNYPVDVYLDGTGRLYIADRGNNRIQVWSY